MYETNNFLTVAEADAWLNSRDKQFDVVGYMLVPNVQEEAMKVWITIKFK